MFLLVPAYPGCPGSKAVKRSLLLLLFTNSYNKMQLHPIHGSISHMAHTRYKSYLQYTAANITTTILQPQCRSIFDSQHSQLKPVRSYCSSFAAHMPLLTVNYCISIGKDTSYNVICTVSYHTYTSVK